MEITFLMLTPGTQFPKMQPDSRSRYRAEVPQGWGSWQDLRAGKAQRGQQEKKARHPSHRALGKHHIAEIEMQWGEKLSSENILQYPRNISLQCKWLSMAQRCLFFGDSSGQGRSELSLTAAPQLQEKIVLTSPSVFCACVVESDWWWSGRDAVSSCEPTAKDALDWCHLNFSKGTNKSCCCPAWMPGGKLSDSLLVFSRAW